jgi:hypothetical protein
MRIRVPSAKGNPQALEEIRRNLASVVGVMTVEVNEAIGTLTIAYDPSKHLDFEQHLANEQHQEHVSLVCAPKLGELSSIEDLFTKETEFLATHSHTAQALMDFVNKLDRGIKQSTGNAVDLKVIAPLVLAAGIFLEVGIAAATPVWLTLSLFSFNHFVDIHSHHPANGSAPPAGSDTLPAEEPKPAPRRKPRLP